MRHLLLSIMLGLTLFACGGSDGIDDAPNCTQLGVAVGEIGDLTDEQLDRFGERLVTLLGQAAANDAQLEVAICSQLADEVAGKEVEETFQDIAEQLEGD